MTRNEFLNDVITFGELKDFCYDYDCTMLEDVYDEEGRDDYINECLMDWARDDSWQELYSRLDGIPTGYDWYRYDDYGEWCGLDDGDFEEYKDDVLEWGDDNDIWDEDEEEDDTDIFAEEIDADMADEEDEPVEDEDFSVDALMGMCSVAFVTIQKENIQRLQEEERVLGTLVDVNIPKLIR